MSLAFWFWLLMAIWFLFGGSIVYRNREGLAPFYWGIGWNLFLFLILIIIGLKNFSDPFSTLVK